MSTRVKIVTDSTAYLLPETVARYDIRVVPLKVIFGNESFASPRQSGRRAVRKGWVKVTVT